MNQNDEFLPKYFSQSCDLEATWNIEWIALEP